MGEASLGCQGGGGGELAGPELERGEAVRRQKTGQLGDEAGVCAQAVRSAIEGGGRLMAGDFGHEGGDVGGGDVRRVAEDEREAEAEGPGPVGGDEGGTVGQVEGGGVAGGEVRCRGREIRAEAEGGGEFGQGGQEQAAGAGAEVEDSGDRVPIREMGERCLDEGFGIRPWDQGGGGDGDIDGPEPLAAGDVGQRFTCRAAGDEGGEFGVVEGGLLGKRGGCGLVEGMGEEQPGLALGVFDAGAVEGCGGMAQRVGNEHNGGQSEPLPRGKPGEVASMRCLLPRFLMARPVMLGWMMGGAAVFGASTAMASPPSAAAAAPPPGGPRVVHFQVEDETDPQEVSEDTVIFLNGQQVAHFKLDHAHNYSVADITAPAQGPYEYALCGRITVSLPDGQTQQKVVDGGATLTNVNGRLYRALAANDFSLFYLSDSQADPPLPPADARHTDACSLPVS